MQATQSLVNATQLPRPTGCVSDFDFLSGDWTVLNRRLVKRWIGCTEWEEFPATFHCDLHLGGVANVDEMTVPSKGFSGMTVRSFNIEQQRWAIYWINSKSGVLCPPVHGGFSGDRGDFYGEDTEEGQPISVHFVWTRIDNQHARWHQAFSRDDKNWEINWVMEFSRLPDARTTV